MSPCDVVSEPISCDDDLFPRELASKYRRDDLTVIETGETLEDIEQIETAEGDVIYAKLIKSPIRKDGKIVGVQAEFWDITQQVKAEKSAKASDERLNLYLEHNPAPSWLFDEEMKLRLCNLAFAQLLSKPKADLIGRTAEEFLPSHFPRELRERCEAEMLSDDATQSLATIQLKDGKEAHYLMIRFPCRGANDQTWTGGMALDISERANTERALRDSESRLRLLAHASDDAVWDHQLGKGPLWRNQAYIELLGPSNDPEDATYDWWASQIIPEEREQVVQSFEDAIANPEISRWIQDYQMVGRAGTPLFLHEIVYISRNSAGKAERLVGSIRNLTGLHEERERKESHEAQLRETQKLESLGVLAGGIAHDFNNLLTSILGNLDLAIAGLPRDSDTAGLLKDVEQSSLRAADLCQQMLAYSGKGRFEVRRLQLSEFIREMEGLLGLSVSKKALIQFDLSEEPSTVEADPTQLQQVIMNLVINASEAFEGQSGSIRISTSLENISASEMTDFYRASDLPPGKYVRMEVTDSGKGMDEATVSRIFEPFFTTKFTGRGLGLAAVLGIVRGHKGAIRVQSELGTGTSFRIIKTAARILERAGYDVELATDGEHGVRSFQNAGGAIQLVLMDLTMPKMDGVEACEQIRSTGPGTPVLVMSGYSEQDTVRKFANGSVAGFVQKPFHPDVLLTQVQRIMEDSVL